MEEKKIRHNEKEYGRMMGMNVDMVFFVIAWDGRVTGFNRKYREKLGFSKDISGYIQMVCLNYTFNCITDKRTPSEQPEECEIDITKNN